MTIYLKRFLIWVAALLACVLLFAGWLWAEKTTAMGCRLISSLPAGEVQSFSPEGLTLFWDDRELFRDETTDMWYLPVDNREEWDGLLTSNQQGFRIYLPRTEWADKAGAIMGGQSRTLYLSNGSLCYALKVYLCQDPVISLDSDDSTRNLNPEGAVYTGQLRFWWPDAQKDDLGYYVGAATWHTRGNDAQWADKKSWRITLLTETGEEADLPLLNMRTDGDWILNSGYSDATMAREKVGYELWNALAARESQDLPSTQIEYVEVLVDGRYQGVYELSYPVDRKALQLTNRDILYKWRAPSLPWNSWALSTFDNKGLMEWDGTISIKWPAEAYPGIWTPLETYSNFFFLGENQGGWEQAEQLTDLYNLLDVALYKQYIGGVDNAFNNIFYLYQFDQNRILRLPWDVDRSMGDGDPGEPLNPDAAWTLLEDFELDTLAASDSDRLNALLAERWQYLRTYYFDTDTVIERMTDCVQQLIDSGAWARNYALWPLPENSLGLEETLTYLDNHTAFLDEQFLERGWPVPEE